MEVEIQPRTNFGELQGGPEQLSCCSQTPSTPFLNDRDQQFFMSRNQVEKKTQTCFLDGLFKAKSRTCLLPRPHLVVAHKTKLLSHPKLISKTSQLLIHLKSTSVFRSQYTTSHNPMGDCLVPSVLSEPLGRQLPLEQSQI